MSFNIHSLGTKLAAFMGVTLVALALIHGLWLIPMEQREAAANGAQVGRVFARHLAVTGGLALLGGSVMAMFVRRTKRRFYDLIRAVSEGRGLSTPISEKRSEIDAFASVLWELFEKVRQSEQKYRALVDNYHGLIVAADANQNITFVGKGLKETLGYEPEEVIGTPLFRACHLEDLQRAEEAFQRVVAGESLKNFEVRYAHKSGRWVDFLGNVSPLHGPAKEVQGILIAAVEVTDAKRMEKHLQLLSTAVESSSDLVGIGNLDGTILYMNPAASRALGYDAYELIGRNTRMLSTKTETEIAEALHQTQERGTGAATTRLRRKNGSSFPCEYTLTVIKDSGGRPMGVVWVGRDVTERLEAEERLRQAQKMETVGVLAGGIAHDFNNLLGGIVGYASILRSSIPKGNPEHDYASMIEKAAARASELTSALLSFARRGKGRQFPTDLNDVVREAISLFQAPGRKNDNVRCCFHPGRIVVEADPTQIHQAVLNVLINARDAAGVSGNIEIETHVREADASFCELHPECRPGKYAVITVKDDGPGMDEETAKRAFEPFFSTKTDRRRTGLGLPITYNIIKNYEGCVDIQSELGQGTTVRIYLPLSGREVCVAEAGPELVRGSETLLVIDDDEMMRSALSEMLTRLGYKVASAADSWTGIDMYRERKGEIDLVIIDMVLSDMSGEETFRQLKAINPGVKAVLSSVYPFDANASRILQEGARRFIHKPYNIQELSSAVRKVLDGE